MANGIQRSLVSENGMPFDIVDRHSQWNFGPGALQTFNGWQYAAYWDDTKQVSVARRKLPDGPWAVVSLSDYQRTSTGDRGKGGVISRGFGDGHEKVAMGISSDGYIHLSFDHHLSTLRYRRSIQPIAKAPERVVWNEKLFGIVQNHLGIIDSRSHRNDAQKIVDQTAPKLESVTYPSFVSHGNSMLLYLRLGGGSGAANSHLFHYSGGSWSPRDEPSSQFIDQRWSGGDGTVNAYPFGLVFQHGRCHLTWCWRDNPDHRTSHDLCYAYSDDGGIHWCNNDGRLVATRGLEFITADTPGITVMKIPPGHGYRNGGSMVVDEESRVHVLARGPNGDPTIYQRDPQAGDWTRMQTPQLGKLLTYNGNLYLVSNDTFYRTNPADPTKFKVLASGFESTFEDSKLSLDLQRPSHDGWTSIIGQKDKNITVIDVKLE
ncbi:BNR repeat-containing protein [Crateriforma spongiae]|uniref:BNR repeat-containing protein n=1 Tax=Crateriforma spongiae TaxID=2724528 RepID=UPI0039AF3EE8